jgi:hypothetical protein
MKKNNKGRLIINFTVTQFIDLGLHLGHTRQNSVFLAA